MFTRFISLFYRLVLITLFLIGTLLTSDKRLPVAQATGASDTKGTIIYVDQNATGSDDGSSWANAFTDLQDALQAATAGQEIWVVGGLYKPTSSTDRTISFNLKSGVHIFGGFYGGETDKTQRIPDATPTVLTGDLKANDSPLEPYGYRYYYTAPTDSLSIDNSYHVVTCTSLSATTVVDNIFITSGHANGTNNNQNIGAGIFINNCANYLWLTNLTIIGNGANQGGGLFIQNSHPTLMRVKIDNNGAFDKGGGIYNDLNSIPLIKESYIRGNQAFYGGAIYSVESTPTLVNSLLSGNEAFFKGGALYNLNAAPKLINVTMEYNFTDNAKGGGGLYNDGGFATPKIINSIIWGNLPDQYVNINGGSMDVTYSNIQGGFSGTGNINIDPLFIKPTEVFPSLTNAGNYRISPFSGCIEKGNNTAVQTPVIYPDDLDGNVRVFDADRNGVATVDMGAYESQQSISRVFLPLLNK